MTSYNWNYEDMGFRSQKEMEESIARVQRRKAMGEVEREIERRKEAQSGIGSNGNIDLAAINEGARLEELDRVVQSRMLNDKEQAKAQAEQEKVQALLKAVSDNVTTEKEVEAEREFRKQKEKADAELQKEIYKKHNVKTDKEIEIDNAYGEMLKGLNM